MKQKGFILVVSLIFMAIMSILAIYMFSGFTTDAVLSANSREKSRSLDAAQSALDAAALWLGTGINTYNGTWNVGAACTTTNATICVSATALTSPSDPSTWGSYTTFTPSTMAGLVSAGGGQGTYAAVTQYYIQYLGPVSGSTTDVMYQVTATAQGGNAAAVSVVQAVYEVSTTSKCLSCP